MSEIVESVRKSLKKFLTIENDTQLPGPEQNNQASKENKITSLMKELEFDQVYILSVSGIQSEPEFKIGVALSDYSCVIYSVGQFLSRTITLSHNRAPIVGIKFSPTSRDILYIANAAGLVTACDLRADGKVVAEFKDDSDDGEMKPLASFDVSCNERLIAGGTENTEGDAFILFWDIRKSNSKNGESLLGGYWDSHQDDITSLTFHPAKQTVLASGSTDGLINVFDLTQPSEDVALTHSLNTESSVDRLGWLTDDSLWCTTHTHALQLWNCEDASAYATFTRNQFAESQNNEPDDCYVVRFHPTKTFEQPFVLAGCSAAKGESLRCLNVANDRLETLYELDNNKQVVRDSWIHEKSGSLVTVGESGIIDVWRQAESTEQDTSCELVDKVDVVESHRTKPY
ncbi:hypothetical protein DMN91_002428 [Ooceraea biroi]|uniref:WD repeat-containing protein 89 n=1 Tax=Ooceraea biroi TaxID=2015173 RepID=A0A026WPX4_OOCBI|nr:WD repeat-containing protein 89 [Ooceraea biroi]EZA57721.1 WD repeat-containing protein [Ooceraea biroi]RLU24340.1 hypothetical protein DMN91_002428 [Ooceraea biroi]